MDQPLPPLSGEISPVVKRQIAQWATDNDLPPTKRTRERSLASHHPGAKLVDAVHVLAANLNRLVEIQKDRKTGLSSNALIAKKAGVSSNTVGRMRRGDGSVGIGKLSSVARVFGLQANQLLTPGLNPSDPPEIVSDDDEKMLLKVFRAKHGDAPPHLTPKH